MMKGGQPCSRTIHRPKMPALSAELCLVKQLQEHLISIEAIGSLALWFDSAILIHRVGLALGSGSGSEEPDLSFHCGLPDYRLLNLRLTLEDLLPPPSPRLNEYTLFLTQFALLYPFKQCPVSIRDRLQRFIDISEEI